MPRAGRDVTLIGNSFLIPPPHPRQSMNLAENDLHVLELDAEADVDEDHCTICLQAIVDRALIPECSYEFCFECLMIWSGKKSLSLQPILSHVSQYLFKIF